MRAGAVGEAEGAGQEAGRLLPGRAAGRHGVEARGQADDGVAEGAQGPDGGQRRGRRQTPDGQGARVQVVQGAQTGRGERRAVRPGPGTLDVRGHRRRRPRRRHQARRVQPGRGRGVLQTRRRGGGGRAGRARRTGRTPGRGGRPVRRPDVRQLGRVWRSTRPRIWRRHARRGRRVRWQHYTFGRVTIDMPVPKNYLIHTAAMCDVAHLKICVCI